MQRRLFEPRNMCSEEHGKLVDVHAFLRFDFQGPGFILHEESGGLVAVHDDIGDPAREEDFRSRLLDHLDGDIGDAVVVAKIVGSDEAVLACDHLSIELRRDAGCGSLAVLSAAGGCRRLSGAAEVVVDDCHYSGLNIGMDLLFSRS